MQSLSHHDPRQFRVLSSPLSGLLVNISSTRFLSWARVGKSTQRLYLNHSPSSSAWYWIEYGGHVTALHQSQLTWGFPCPSTLVTVMSGCHGGGCVNSHCGYKYYLASRRYYSGSSILTLFYNNIQAFQRCFQKLKKTNYIMLPVRRCRRCRPRRPGRTCPPGRSRRAPRHPGAGGHRTRGSGSWAAANQMRAQHHVTTASANHSTPYAAPLALQRHGAV